MATQQLTLALDTALVLDFLTACQVRRVRPEAEIETLLALYLDAWACVGRQRLGHELEDEAPVAREER